MINTNIINTLVGPKYTINIELLFTNLDINREQIKRIMCSFTHFSNNRNEVIDSIEAKKF